MKTKVLYPFFLILFFFDNIPVAPAQRDFNPPKRRSIYTTTEASKIEASIITDKRPKARSSKVYYWFDNKSIQTTQGGYSGNLLHGKYVAYYYPQNNLQQKGVFRNGLKHGTWSHWDANGVLREQSRWNKGKLTRQRLLYDTGGKLSKIELYKKGSLYAFQAVVNDTPVGKKIYTHPDTSARKSFFTVTKEWTASVSKTFRKKSATQKK